MTEPLSTPAVQRLDGVGTRSRSPRTKPTLTQKCSTTERSRRTNMASTTRRHKGIRPRFYSLALSIPGLSRPVACIVTAFTQRDAHRQALNILRRIKVRVVPPGCNELTPSRKSVR